MTDIRGTFTIELTPGEAVISETQRVSFVKHWSGDISGTGEGVMLLPGSSHAAAGYIALETFAGNVGDRFGTVAFQQLGLRYDDDHSELHYHVAPGSGTGELVGLTGTLDIEIDDDGTHQVTLHLPD